MNLHFPSWDCKRAKKQIHFKNTAWISYRGHQHWHFFIASKRFAKDTYLNFAKNPSFFKWLSRSSLFQGFIKFPTTLKWKNKQKSVKWQEPNWYKTRNHSYRYRVVSFQVPWETSGLDPSENLSQAPHIHHQSSSRLHCFSIYTVYNCKNPTFPMSINEIPEEKKRKYTNKQNKIGLKRRRINTHPTTWRNPIWLYLCNSLPVRETKQAMFSNRQ